MSDRKYFTNVRFTWNKFQVDSNMQAIRRMYNMMHTQYISTRGLLSVWMTLSLKFITSMYYLSLTYEIGKYNH